MIISTIILHIFEQDQCIQNGILLIFSFVTAVSRVENTKYFDSRRDYIIVYISQTSLTLLILLNVNYREGVGESDFVFT